MQFAYRWVQRDDCLLIYFASVSFGDVQFVSKKEWSSWRAPLSGTHVAMASPWTPLDPISATARAPGGRRRNHRCALTTMVSYCRYSLESAFEPPPPQIFQVLAFTICIPVFSTVILFCTNSNLEFENYANATAIPRGNPFEQSVTFVSGGDDAVTIVR